MRKFTMLALAAAAVLGAGGPAARADDDSERAANDVRVRLTLGRRMSGSPLAKIRVKNRGTLPQAGVRVQLFAGDASGTELFSATVDLARGATRGFRFRVALPEGATQLTATATPDGVADENPWDNTDVEALGGAGGGGGGTVALTAAQRGLVLYSAACAACHGADALGGTSGAGLVGRSASDILEATLTGKPAEAEDGGTAGAMPAFPGIGLDEARDLAAFLRDPGAVTLPPPPPPPPAGTPPTYSGQVKALMSAYCTVCHSGTTASMGVRLDTYKSASANAAAALAAIQAGTMPKGGAVLPPADVQLLRDWIDAGKPQ